MELLTKYNLSTSKILKIAGLVLLALIILAVCIRLIGSSFNSVITGRSGSGGYTTQNAGLGYSKDAGIMNFETANDSIGLSQRNVASTPTVAPKSNEKSTIKNDEEDLEVTEYRATIETRQLKNACSKISDLKAKEFVIFENAQEDDNSCDYTFKVKRENVNEVLSWIKDMKPKNLSENSYTIKKLVDDFTSEEEILKNKLNSIDSTLTKAVSAYDDITALATRVQDAESLAKIINSKISIIERLTQERINVNSELERIKRSKAEQLERLEYTYFYVNIYESKFIDTKILKDSWKTTIKGFVSDVNKISQDITVNLVSFLLYVLLYAVYIFILLIGVKYAWKAIKYIWNK